MRVFYSGLGSTTQTALAHAALLAPVQLHYRFKNSDPHFQSCPERRRLISCGTSRNIQLLPSSDPLPSSPPTLFIGDQTSIC